MLGIWTRIQKGYTMHDVDSNLHFLNIYLYEYGVSMWNETIYQIEDGS